MSCSNVAFFTLVIFLIVIQHGSSLQCYNCKSGRDEPCGNPTPTNGVDILQCNNPRDVCYHFDINVKGSKGHPQYVERGCVAGNPSVIKCPTEGSDNRCTVCGRNLCNNAPTALRAANHTQVGSNNDDATGKKDDGGNSGIRSAASSFLSIFIITSWLIKLLDTI